MRFIGIVVWLALVSGLSAATLSNPRRVGTAFEFTIAGESNAIYAIEASWDLQNWMTVVTNRQVGDVRTISMPASAQEEFYRVRLLQPIFAGAMGARDSVEFKGSGVLVNSFDSADPNYSGPDGRYDPIKTRDHGDIITSSALTNSLYLGNAKVLGVLRVPPGGGAVLGPGGSVGSFLWLLNGGPGIEPGHLVEEAGRVFVDAELPTGHTYVTPGPGSVGGTNYTYVLSNGHYTLPQFIAGSMVITGRATLYVAGSANVGGRIVIMRGASLDLYVGGADASINLSGVVNESGNAAAFAYYGLPGNTNVSVAGTGAFAGTIYAPAADVAIGAGGNDEVDIIGAVIARNIRVNGKLNMHYDERLGVAGPAW